MRTGYVYDADLQGDRRITREDDGWDSHLNSNWFAERDILAYDADNAAPGLDVSPSETFTCHVPLDDIYGASSSLLDEFVYHTVR